jgi:hypothetical protein
MSGSVGTAPPQEPPGKEAFVKGEERILEIQGRPVRESAVTFVARAYADQIANGTLLFRDIDPRAKNILLANQGSYEQNQAIKTGQPKWRLPSDLRFSANVVVRGETLNLLASSNDLMYMRKLRGQPDFAIEDSPKVLSRKKPPASGSPEPPQSVPTDADEVSRDKPSPEMASPPVADPAPSPIPARATRLFDVPPSLPGQPEWSRPKASDWSSTGSHLSIFSRVPHSARVIRPLSTDPDAPEVKTFAGRRRAEPGLTVTGYLRSEPAWKQLLERKGILQSTLQTDLELVEEWQKTRLNFNRFANANANHPKVAILRSVVRDMNGTVTSALLDDVDLAHKIVAPAELGDVLGTGPKRDTAVKSPSFV